jgi:hypothetical protein
MNLSTLLSGLTNCASSTGNRGKKKQNNNNNNNRRTQDGRKFMLAVAIALFRFWRSLKEKLLGEQIDYNRRAPSSPSFSLNPNLQSA